MRKVILLCAALFVVSFAGIDEPVMIRSKHNLFTADNLGNVYLAKGEELLKYGPSGKFLSRYSNLKYGDITAIDATNPLKIILYYRDFQQIVFLDDQLSANSEAVSLEKLGYEQADLVCAAANNGFWLYSKQNNELVRFNETAKKITSTGNLKQVLQADISPNFITEHNGFLFLNSPATGIYVFDMFGAFSKVISIKGLSRFDVDENVIYYQKDETICSYQHKLFEEACKTISTNARPGSVKFQNHCLYLDFHDSLEVRKFNN